MSIQYAPKSGTIILCDFSGIAQEMVKRRPVVVLSSVSAKLCIVVPLSTTWPQPIQPWHYLLKLQAELPRPYSTPECWAKCDMVAAVSFERLNLLFSGKDRYGKRIYATPRLPDNDLDAIRACVCEAISN